MKEEETGTVMLGSNSRIAVEKAGSQAVIRISSPDGYAELICLMKKDILYVGKIRNRL